MIFLCGVNLLFTFPLQISTSVIVAYDRFVFKNGINLIRTFLQPAVMLFLLYLVNMKAVGAIVIVTLFNLLTYLSYYIYAVKKLDFHFAIKKFDKSLIKSLVTFSGWMFLMMLFEQLQFNSGQFILGLFQGTEVIAVWGISMIFILNYRSLSTAITNVFLPSFLKYSFNNDMKGISSTAFKITRLQAYVLFTILFNFIIFGRDFINLWAGEAYQEAYNCAVIVMVPMTFALILDFCYLSQIARNQLKFRTVTLFSGFFLSFAIFYFCYGVTLLTYALIVSMSVIIGQILCVIIYINRNMEVDLFRIFLSILKAVGLPLLFAVAFFFLYKYSYVLFNNEIWAIVIGAICFNICLIIILWFSSFSKDEKMMIMKFLR